MLVCGKCDHFDQITIEDNEINCSFCGNVQIIGKDARLPFTRKDSPPPVQKPIQETDHDESGTSPMQTGERIKQEGKDMGAANTGKCAVCGAAGAVASFMCPGCFKGRYGITVEEYKANKLHRTEQAGSVARRLKEKDVSKQESNPRPEEVGAVRPAPPPPPPKPYNAMKEAVAVTEDDVMRKVETMPDITQQDKDALLHLYSEGPFLIIKLAPELKAMLKDKAVENYRTMELHAAYLIDKGLRA